VEQCVIVLTLKRLTSSVKGTTGVLIKDDWPLCVTLEDPWRNNQQHISCIPEGTYKCKKIHSPKFGPTYEITSVPDRTHILFHCGNTVQDTSGCILLGTSFGFSGIRDSRHAFMKFYNLMEEREEFLLEIKR